MNYDMADPLPKSCEPGRLALGTAASSRSNLLFLAPPGAGALMLARRLPGILPEPSASARAAVEAVYSKAEIPVPQGRPFRAPHYTASHPAIFGCERRAGEVQLARFGVLFLDSPLQFRPEVLREVFAAKEVTSGEVLVVAHEYPSECGFEPGSEYCGCPPGLLALWGQKLGELARNFSIVVELPSRRGILASPSGECSADVRARVAREWAAQGFQS